MIRNAVKMDNISIILKLKGRITGMLMSRILNL